jgi:two-component system response regulator MprA
MSSQSRILVVEDDRAVIGAIDLALKHHGYRVMFAMDGKEGLETALRERPDLVILDVMLPSLDGMEICRQLRQLQFDSPILMLTTRALVEDRVTGLNAGADDYLAKPFALAEFIARINALLRRRQAEHRPRVLELGDVRIDLGQRTATRAGEPLSLTKTEYALLDLLARHAGHPVSRESMLDVVWGYTRFPTTRTIDTHIWRLRKKIGDGGEAPRWLKPVHDQGYCLIVGESGPGGA